METNELFEKRKEVMLKVLENDSFSNFLGLEVITYEDKYIGKYNDLKHVIELTNGDYLQLKDNQKVVSIINDEIKSSMNIDDNSRQELLLSKE